MSAQELRGQMVTKLSCTALCDLEGSSHPLSCLALSRIAWRDSLGEPGFLERDALNPEKILGETGKSLWFPTWV